MNDNRAVESQGWALASLYAASIAGYPLISGLPVVLGVDNRAVTVPYRAFILLMSLGVMLLALRRRGLYAGALWFPLGGFWVLYLGRMLWDTLISPVPLGRPPVEYFLYGIGTCLVPMLALFTKPSGDTLRLALRLTTVSAFLAVLAVLYIGVQSAVSGDLRAAVSGRFSLETLGPISVGHLGVSLTSLSLFQLRMRGHRSLVASLSLLCAALLGAVAIGVAASKGPLLALLVSLCFLLALDWREGLRVRPMVLAIVGPLVAVQAALFFETQLGFRIVTRLHEGLDDPARLDLLRGAIDQFLAHPLLGSSLDTGGALPYPHNVIIESFMAIGVLGGLCYLGFHAGALRHALRLAIGKPTSGWVGMLCLQYTVGAMFSGALYLSGAMWAMLAASVTASDLSGVTAHVVRADRRYPTMSASPQ